MGNLTVPEGFGWKDNDGKGHQEKPLSITFKATVPQTDTGSQGENPKVLE